MRVFHLQFNKEADGLWYIDFPGYPFDHHNLMMVAGADLLCEYVARKEGHPGCALVDVTLGDNKLDGKDPEIIMTRYEMGYGAHYDVTDSLGKAPIVDIEGHIQEIRKAWICPVTLLVLFSYPKQINHYLK